MTIFMTSIRDFFSVLDLIVYSLMSSAFKMFDTIANQQILAPVLIEKITARIYAFIGLFMIFKISFSLINYLIDPNKLSDKTAGAGNLIKRTVISLVLVIVVPFGFDLLREAQSVILSDNIIPQLITGKKSDNNFEEKVLMDGYEGKTMCVDENNKTIYAVAKNPGDYISLLALKPFFRINEKYRTTEVGGEGTSTIKDGLILSGEKFINFYCSGGSKDAASTGKLLVSGIHNAPIGLPGVLGNIINEANSTYYISYKFFFSTIIGTIILLLIISMSFDIAVRAIRLLFLEIIAPIPIISYIEPDTNKNKIFSKWFKDVWTTWLGLFIRMGAIYLVVELLSLIMLNLPKTDNELGPLVGLMFIIGLLMFAKQIPKVIEELFGIKSAGFTLNPLKKIKDGATGGAAIAGVAYGTVGALGGGISGARAGAEFGSPMRGALFGATSGFLGGTKSKSIADGFSKNMSQVYKNMTGSELSNFSLQRSLMNFDGSGNKSLAEMKSYLSKANELKNQKETSLTNSKYMTSALAKTLNEKGYNPDEELKKYNSYNSSKLNYDAEYKKYDDYIKKADTFSAEEKQRFSKEINDAMTAREKVQKSLNELPKYDKEVEGMLEKYGENLSTQNVLRKEIQDIDKHISTFNDQKKDIIKGYNLDTSNPTNLKNSKKFVDDNYK